LQKGQWFDSRNSLDRNFNEDTQNPTAEE